MWAVSPLFSVLYAKSLLGYLENSPRTGLKIGVIAAAVVLGLLRALVVFGKLRVGWI